METLKIELAMKSYVNESQIGLVESCVSYNSGITFVCVVVLGSIFFAVTIRRCLRIEFPFYRWYLQAILRMPWLFAAACE